MIFDDFLLVRRDVRLREGRRGSPAVLERADQALLLVRLEEGDGSPTASEAEALAEACRKGWLTPPKVISGDPPPRHPMAPMDQLLEELQADREDR